MIWNSYFSISLDSVLGFLKFLCDEIILFSD